MNKYQNKHFYIRLSSSLVCLSLSYLFITPYLAIFSFKQALDRLDENKISSFVIFPSIRESLKRQLNYSFQEVIESNYSSTLAPLGSIFFRPVVNRIVDATVTPKGLQYLIRTGSLTKSFNQTQGSNNNSLSLPKKNKSNYSLYYVNINKFILSSSKSESENPLKLVWIRFGLKSWKLSDIEIPTSILVNQLLR